MRPLTFRVLYTRSRRLLVDVALSALAYFSVVIPQLIVGAHFGSYDQVGRKLWNVAIYACVAAAALTISRTYRMIWRYVSFRDLLSLVQASVLTLLGYLAIKYVFFHAGGETPPTLVVRMIGLILIVNLGFLSVPRFISRAIWETNLAREPFKRGYPMSSTPVFVTGDTERIEIFMRECVRDPSARYRVVGVLLDDSRLHGSYLHGVEVVGSVSGLDTILQRIRANRTHLPQMLILAKDNATRFDFEELVDAAASAGLKVARLPRHGSFQNGSAVEPIQLADLLGRPEIVTDTAAVAALVKGKCVLVTGAGGSIGSELTRQIARLNPSKLIMMDSGEFNLYSIEQEMEERFPRLMRQSALVDVRDGALVSSWIAAQRPEIVFHAAALKHVPLVENNPIEGIKTNVIGTVNVAEACCKFGVQAMVVISTDKAVNPCNVMGATKRMAEAYCQGLDDSNECPGSTRFITVRFGNVLGSAGSVVPLFARQIEQGGPITVTHPEIKRYFMTIPEAVTLVLQAGAQSIGRDDERGHIYVLDMGEPVKIIDLARQMIRLSGQRPDIDVEIKVVGLRPGEKLYEEIIHCDEGVTETQNKSILTLRPRVTNFKILHQQVHELRNACITGDRERAIRMLRISVPEYSGAQETRAVAAT